jgi:putative two-component system response regulator
MVRCSARIGRSFQDFERPNATYIEWSIFMSSSISAPSTVAVGAMPFVADRSGYTATADLFAGMGRTARSAKIMIIDDEPANIKVVQRYLSGVGFERFVTTTDSTAATSVIEAEQPDLILLDEMMPQTSGLELLEHIREIERFRLTPVLILTTSGDGQGKMAALILGATDFLAKPVDPNELALRVRNALVVKAHQDSLTNQAECLEALVRARTKELVRSRREVIHCLARAAEFRDNDTGHHIIRVGKSAKVVALQLGLSQRHADLIEHAATLHDVGKIGIPDAILLKPGKLEPDEFKLMQTHCDIGRRILLKLPAEGLELAGAGGSPVLKMAAIIAQTHHEKWDGSGYPLGLSGDDIPIEGRITAVVDVFDALTNKRTYKQAFQMGRSRGIIQSQSGTHFDPDVVAAFVARWDEILTIRQQFGDPVP